MILLSILAAINFSITAQATEQLNVARSTNPKGAAPFKKIFTVILENANYSEAVSKPFLGQLVRNGANFSNMLAESHPSQPNYIAMISGSTLGVTGDGSVNLSGRNIADLIEDSGRTWKVYAEGYPGNCYKGSSTGGYARKHLPFISFTSIQSNPARCANIVNAHQFDEDLRNGQLPDYSFFVPDMNNNGHDTNVAYADRYLAQRFGPILQNEQFMKDMLFVVTFDENDSYLKPNQIFTVLYGHSVIPGSQNSDRLNHYSLLRLVEETWNLGSLKQNDMIAPAITGIFQ